MTLPTLTPEQRDAALKRAAEVRGARADLKEQLKAGTLTVPDLLTSGDADIVGKMRVSTILESLPRIGKVKAASLMADVGIAASRRVRGLGDRQRSALIAALAESR
jgi:hypothetical protein